jgi:translocation and assembly module TamB
LTLTTDGGELQASGQAKLAGLRPTSLDAEVHARRFPIVEPPVIAWLDSTILIHGQMQNSILTGTLTVKEGAARLPKLATGRTLQSTAPLADVVFVDAQAQREARERSASRQANLRTTARLSAHIPGPFFIRSKELNADLKGQLQIELTGRAAKLSGTVESTWGAVEILGRRYNLERARLGFDGSAEPNPQLDIRATRDIRDATIAIEVRGTAKKPQLVLTSDPPIYDQSQVVALILSGDPGAAHISDHSLDQTVVGAISGVVVNKIKDQIAPGLPVDVIEISTSTHGAATGPADYTGLGSARVAVGKFLTQQIYVRYVHQFGGTTGLRKLNANQAQIEYRFKRHFEIDTMYGDAGAGAIDFFWTLRY